jgi:hypothetical protein
MRARDAVYTVISRLAALLTRSHRRSDFVCGECERWEQCGLPPNVDCIVKAKQIARNDRQSRVRAYLPGC